MQRENLICVLVKFVVSIVLSVCPGVILLLLQLQSIHGFIGCLLIFVFVIVVVDVVSLLILLLCRLLI